MEKTENPNLWLRRYIVSLLATVKRPSKQLELQALVSGLRLVDEARAEMVKLIAEMGGEPKKEEKADENV